MVIVVVSVALESEIFLNEFLISQNEELTNLAEEARTLKDELDIMKHTTDKVVCFKSLDLLKIILFSHKQCTSSVPKGCMPIHLHPFGTEQANVQCYESLCVYFRTICMYMNTYTPTSTFTHHLIPFNSRPNMRHQ